MFIGLSLSRHTTRLEEPITARRVSNFGSWHKEPLLHSLQTDSPGPQVEMALPRTLVLTPRPAPRRAATSHLKCFLVRLFRQFMNQNQRIKDMSLVGEFPASFGCWPSSADCGCGSSEATSGKTNEEGSKT